MSDNYCVLRPLGQGRSRLLLKSEKLLCRVGFFFIFMQPDKAPPIISSRTTSPRVRSTHKYGSVLVSVAAWTPAGSTVEATLSNFLASFDFSTFLLRPFLTRVTEPWTGIVETGLIRLTLQPTGGKRQSYTNCVNVVVYDIRGVGGED